MIRRIVAFVTILPQMVIHLGAYGKTNFVVYPTPPVISPHPPILVMLCLHYLQYQLWQVLR